MTKAIFPGTFDPFTIGHGSIVERALAFVDHLTIAIGINDSKRACLSPEKRLEMIANYYSGNDRIDVALYDCLTVDFALQTGASLIVRGVRTVKDFEYEENIADINRKLAGIETVFMFALPELACVSSSMVRELLHYGKDISPFIPKDMDIKL